jgi:hypothetical protein
MEYAGVATIVQNKNVNAICFIVNAIFFIGNKVICNKVIVSF